MCRYFSVPFKPATARYFLCFVVIARMMSIFMTAFTVIVGE